MIAARKDAGLTQVELAEQLDRPQSFVSKYERGDEKYMRMNLDRLKIGEFAVIDEAYWETTKRLTTYCVRQIAAWAIGQR